MSSPLFVSVDDIRTRFSAVMSEMYRTEVPQYGALLDLVKSVNTTTLEHDTSLREGMIRHKEMDRLDVERHGAIRLGTALELSTMRRVFAVMGMFPVGYYDLSVAGVPVHSTAFRPVDDASLRINPFRVFTSLLRLDLISDPSLRDDVEAILARRRIFSDRALALVAQAETNGGLDDAQADEFVGEVRETFRWHSQATVNAATYKRLHDAHRLIADVVSFKGPHINHLTPRTLDIDKAQAEMPRRGMRAKAVIEGPPARRHPILLRQTSFTALEEAIVFPDDQGGVSGTHTARFGEIEQRGMALTPAGRQLYDALLARVRDDDAVGSSSNDYATRLTDAFTAFPDDLAEIHARRLAFFRYAVKDAEAFKSTVSADPRADFNLDRLLQAGVIDATPIIYEDFLPVSAAGIFQSNLGGAEQQSYAANAAKSAFEANLGAAVWDELMLYERTQEASITDLTRIYASLSPSELVVNKPLP